MSREFRQAMATYHEDLARKFAAGDNGVKRHVEVRITDAMYVYLHEDGIHVQTQTVAIPEAWWDNWPSDLTVRRHIRQHCALGTARITTLEA